MEKKEKEKEKSGLSQQEISSAILKAQNIFQYDRKINQKRTTELQQVKMNLDSTQSLITVNNNKK